MRRSMPVIHASAAARWCSLEKSSVTFTGIPWWIASVIAGSPSFVPGILMKTFGRSMRVASSRTCAIVAPVVSNARFGETSSDTKPSRCAVRSCTSANSSAARRRSSIARSKKTSSSVRPASLPTSAIWSS